MDLLAKYDKEYNTTVLRKMYNHDLGLGEPLHYYNMLVDINGNKLGSLFWTSFDKYFNTIVRRKNTKLIGTIYKIENKITKKKYIGQTDNIYVRKAKHVWNLYNNSHTSTCLQMDFYLYGIKNFTFEIIEDVEMSKDFKEKIKDTLLQKEKYWIETYCSEYPNGYNSPVKGKSRKEYLNRPSINFLIKFLRTSDKDEEKNILKLWGESK